MKIVFEYSEVTTGTSTALRALVAGDDAHAEWITWKEDSVKPIVEVTPPLRGDRVTVRNRGNRAWALAWSTSRIHESMEAGALFRLTHKRDLAKSAGTLKLFVGNQVFQFLGSFTSIATPVGVTLHSLTVYEFTGTDL